MCDVNVQTKVKQLKVHLKLQDQLLNHSRVIAMSNGLCGSFGICLNVHTLFWLEGGQINMACSLRHLQCR